MIEPDARSKLVAEIAELIDCCFDLAQSADHIIDRVLAELTVRGEPGGERAHLSREEDR